MGYIFLYKKSSPDEMKREDHVNISEDASMFEPNSFEKILRFLDEMNADLVFYQFEELMFSEVQWISRLVSENNNTTEIAQSIDILGKR